MREHIFIIRNMARGRYIILSIVKGKRGARYIGVVRACLRCRGWVGVKSRGEVKGIKGRVRVIKKNIVKVNMLMVTSGDLFIFIHVFSFEIRLEKYKKMIISPLIIIRKNKIEKIKVVFHIDILKHRAVV